jgi:nicotinamide-nucleotide amidase
VDVTRTARAEIVAVGSEMLTPDRVDTNSLFITKRLNEIGVEVIAKTVASDDREVIAGLLRLALTRADLVVFTGGLGPTSDDLTREAVAEALGLPLDEDPATIERLRRRFARRGMPMPDINRKQALVPRGAEVLANDNGTAPGLLIDRGGRLIVLLPGPPREMKPMLEALVRGRLAGLAGRRRVVRRVLKTTGRGESLIEEVAQPIYSRWTEADPPVRTTILATPGSVELHLVVVTDSAERARAVLDAATGELATALGQSLYATDDRRLEEVVGAMLRERGLRIATAESCTGGLLASRLTDVPGSSDYVERGVVCYSNRAKTELLAVPEAMIREHGAVSEQVGIAMARGVREVSRTDLGVGITGIAGPTGGTEAKPVGTVVVAIAWEGGERVRRMWFPGDREQVKFFASQAALDMVRRHLLAPDT